MNRHKGIPLFATIIFFMAVVYGYMAINSPKTLAQAAGQGGLNGPTDIVFDRQGNLYICDTKNNLIRCVNSQNGLHTIAGAGSKDIVRDEPISISEARFTNPTKLITDGENLYFIERSSYVRKLDLASGIITTFAEGNFYRAPGQRFTKEEAELTELERAEKPFRFDILPISLAIGPDNNLYILNSHNQLCWCPLDKQARANFYKRQKEDASFQTEINYKQLKNQLALINFDKNGDLYVVTKYPHIIYKANLESGELIKIAGKEKFTERNSEEGLALEVPFYQLNTFTFDNDNNMILAANTYLYKFDLAAQELKIITGKGKKSSLWEDGIAATNSAIGNCQGIAIDDQGEIFFSDITTHRVRHITKEGLIFIAAA